MPLRPCPEVLEVEVEKIVSFDHVRVEPGDSLPEGDKHFLLFHLPSEEHFGIALVVHQGDGEDPVLLPFRVGEFKSRSAGGFNIESQPVNVFESKPLEKRFACEKQELVDRIGNIKVGCLRR